MAIRLNHRILATVFNVEEMKRDVDELSNIISEDRIPGYEIGNLIGFRRDVRSIYKRELQVLDILGEARITRRFVKKLELLWSKYQNEERDLLLDCCRRLVPRSY